MRSSPFILFLLLSTTLHSARSEEAETYRLLTRRADDVVDVKSGDDEVRLVIRSPAGISQATIERTMAKWPSKVIIQLHLQGLESLKINAESTKIEASLSSHDDSQRVWIAGHEADSLDEQDPYWFSIRRITPTDPQTASKSSKEGWFEFVLPAEFVNNNPTKFTLAWIDFYRG